MLLAIQFGTFFNGKKNNKKTEKCILKLCLSLLLSHFPSINFIHIDNKSELQRNVKKA